ncbi:MAG: chorion class high-cysteine HCB protein 13 [Clostridiales bacterium]|jgi:hypothetical protein|nr:chorion class high-cysteine HCB protein 13 [Clostridiales bacterium]
MFNNGGSCDFIWILLLLNCFGGKDKGCGCGYDRGCGGNTCIDLCDLVWIILLMNCFGGKGSGCGCK